MIKKVLIILNLLLFFACNTFTIPESQPGYVDVSNSLKDFNLDFKDDEFNDILNRVLILSLNQEWDIMFSLLDEVLAGTDETHKKIYLRYVNKMLHIPKLKLRAAELIIKYQEQNTEFYRDLIQLEKEFPSKLKWQAEMETLPMIGDIPCIEVEINGQKCKMLLDTGAQISHLFDDTVKRVGLDGLNLGEINLQDSQNIHSTVSWVLANSIKIGSLEVINEKVITTKRPFGLNDFDGLIGWPIISQLKLTIDHQKKEISFAESKNSEVLESNFLWVDVPVVFTHIKNPELFSLDTGADSSYFNSRVLKDNSISTKKALWSMSMGLNGRKLYRRDKIDHLTMVLDNSLLTFSDYINMPKSLSMFNFVSGVLGSDIIYEGILTLDYPQGKIHYTPY